MQLTPVESSHIAAIGYLEDDHVLLVRYKDGALYASPGWNGVAYENLMRAKSKGKALAVAACANPKVLIQKGGADTREQQPQPEQRADSGASGPLHVMDEDAGKCCREGMTVRIKDVFAGVVQWSCSKCGLVFEPETVGAVRYWRIVPRVVILRK